MCMCACGMQESDSDSDGWDLDTPAVTHEDDTDSDGWDFGDLTFERWCTIDGVEVSNKGRLMLNGRPYFPMPTSTGYCTVTRPGTKSTVTVHVLVATAFIGPKPSDRHTVDHINRDKSDNRVQNLRWATPSEQHANRDNPFKRQSRRMVEAKGVDGEWTRFESVVDAVNACSVNRSDINKVLKGKLKTAKGMSFRYVVLPNIPGEDWRIVHGSWVSSAGRLKRKDGGVFCPIPNKLGYCRFMGRPVHQLVALAFLGPPPSPSHTVDHINRNPSDNQVKNLRWATPSEQRRNTVRAPRTKSGRWKPIKSTDESGNVLEYPHVAQASRESGVNSNTIAYAVKNLDGWAGGFKWEYI